jgi:DNA-directed RNA polymerase, mitochondrial
LIMRDPDAAELVNLIASDEPRDVYKTIVDCVLCWLKTARGRHAMWWRATFAKLKLDDKTKRKLIKTPALAFSYNISDVGMADDIRKVFQEEVSRKKTAQPPKVKDGTPKTGEMYLAKLIREACEEVLPLPARAMEYMQDVAKHCNKEGRFVRLVSPTGMPIVNRYQIAEVKEVQLASGSRHKLKDGATQKLNKSKIVDAVAANVVHSMDASHLCRVVNAAAAEPDPIEVLTVHDSYSCLAPHARRLNQIIRNELAIMYSAYDPLAELRRLNVTGDILPLPERSDLDPLVVLDAPDCF